MSALMCGLMSLVAVQAQEAGKSELTPLQFNEAISKVSKSLESKGRAFGMAIGQEKDPKRLQKLHVDLVADVKAIVRDTKKIAVPGGKEAAAFWQAFQGYLKNQETMVAKDFKEVVDILSSPQPDLQQLKKVLDRIQRIENADLVVVRKAQAEFAKAHGITIK